MLIDPPAPVQVLDETGQPVVVTERGGVLRPPARLGVGDDPPVAVTSWAGPWPVDERWWDPAESTRVARLQLVDVRGRAYLVAGEMRRAGSPALVPRRGLRLMRSMGLTMGWQNPPIPVAGARAPALRPPGTADPARRSAIEEARRWRRLGRVVPAPAGLQLRR